jgi:hypothetical protein
LGDSLGSRTDPVFWNGRAEAAKVRWNNWIGYITDALKSIDVSRSAETAAFELGRLEDLESKEVGPSSIPDIHLN